MQNGYRIIDVKVLRILRRRETMTLSSKTTQLTVRLGSALMLDARYATTDILVIGGQIIRGG